MGRFGDFGPSFDRLRMRLVGGLRMRSVGEPRMSSVGGLRMRLVGEPRMRLAAHYLMVRCEAKPSLEPWATRSLPLHLEIRSRRTPCQAGGFEVRLASM